MKKIVILVCLSIFLTGCQGQWQQDNQTFQTESSVSQKDNKEDTANHGQLPKNNEQNEGENKTMKVFATIENEEFSITLEENEAVELLLEQLPMNITMEDLHGNEKYYYMDQSLPTHSQPVAWIEAGDFMLFGNTCLVLFYESFSTSYSYTRLGHIDQVEAFVDKVGKGSVDVILHQ